MHGHRALRRLGTAAVTWISTGDAKEARDDCQRMAVTGTTGAEPPAPSLLVARFGGTHLGATVLPDSLLRTRASVYSLGRSMRSIPAHTCRPVPLSLDVQASSECEGVADRADDGTKLMTHFYMLRQAVKALQSTSFISLKSVAMSLTQIIPVRR